MTAPSPADRRRVRRSADPGSPRKVQHSIDNNTRRGEFIGLAADADLPTRNCRQRSFAQLRQRSWNMALGRNLAPHASHDRNAAQSCPLRQTDAARAGGVGGGFASETAPTFTLQTARCTAPSVVAKAQVARQAHHHQNEIATRLLASRSTATTAARSGCAGAR